MTQAMFQALVCGSLLFAPGQLDRDTPARLDAEVEPVLQLPRTNAPAAVKCKLKWTGPRVLEGYLEYEVRDATVLVGRFRTNEMVLSDRPQELRLLVPPFDARNSFRELDLKMKFVGKTEGLARARLSKELDLPEKDVPRSNSEDAKEVVFELDNHFVRMPAKAQTLFTVCLCEMWDLSIPQATLALEQEFRLDRVVLPADPEPRVIAGRLPPVSTEVAHISPIDMPGNPLNYCGYDMVVMTRAGLAALRDKQLQAIVQWVEAGGSICVTPGEGLNSTHLKFLNELTQEDPSFSPFMVDPEGKMQGGPQRTEPGAPLLCRKGLGRVAIVPDPSTIDFTEAPWKSALAFLWKIRRDRWDAFVSGRVALENLPGILPNPLDIVEPNRFLPRQVGGWVGQALMPKSIKVISLGSIGVILFLYVSLVGPVDYLVLGRLKLRKLTWIVFPIITLGFTGFTVLLAHQSMRTTDQRQTMAFHDIGAKGKIVRTNRFDLLFTSIGHPVRTEVERGLYLPLNHRDLFGAPVEETQRRRSAPAQLAQLEGDDVLVGAPDYIGGVPSHYTVQQVVPQWTPQVNRLLLIAPEEAGIAFDWDAVKREDLGTPDGRERLLKQITEACGEPVEVQVLHEAERHLVPGSAQGRGCAPETCVQPPQGLFGMIARFAPAGGKNLTDLALLDVGDPAEWLLMVTIRRPDDVLIYRKLYHLP